jgi:putative toxin-antitoxin system antitoxin component (TIGR02293 family)
MERIDRVTAVLGGSRVLGAKPASERDFIALVRKGLPFQSFKRTVRSLNLSDDEARLSLGLPKRTWARRKGQQQGRLPAIESERALRLARVAALAIEVLGSSEKAARWLRAPNTGLGNEAPLALIDTDLGAEGVLAELHRLEYGVFS